MTRAATKGARRRGGLYRAARLLILGPILLVLGYLVFCTLLLGLYRYVPPPITTVQVQRVAGAVVSPDPVTFSRAWRSADNISSHLPNAVVAAEDTRFYQHKGVDWEELAKVREEARRRGRPPARGASTITQQLVKNLFLTTHRSYLRKGLEYPLAYAADFILPKERILELYVNIVEWGPGVYGAEAAAQYHYGTSASQLSREQAARLAAILPAPRSRAPQQQGTYSSIIMQRMRQMGT